tara:strand:+ start:50482 stop:53181 length:2700 start_codon:yes stop_codon:yes gene_type:complete
MHSKSIITALAISCCLVSCCLVSAASAVDILANAASGTPYGVATVEIPIAAPIVGGPLPPLEVRDADGRILYPIANDIRVKIPRPSDQPVPPPGRGRLLGRIGNLVRELTGDQPDLEQTVARRVSFLFRGSSPLTITVSESGREVGSYEVVPAVDPITRTQLLGQWWDGFHQAAKRQIDAADYPPWVENYLVAMLSGRLGMPLPDWYVAQINDDDPLTDTMKLLAGASGTDQQMFRRAAGGTTSPTPTTLPLPAAPAWNPPRLPAVPVTANVEPLAEHVPPECFYIRYGSFENYLWFRDLSDEYGGDLSRMITLHGFKNENAARVERQLNLKTTQLSRMLGPTVIEDQALVGRDLFLSDGATIGVMFKAKNAFLLRSSLVNDRTKLANDDPSVNLVDITIAGKQVSLLSSSDHRVRSFLAEDGEYLFVANSETLVRRFLEVGQSGKSLAATESFRLARQLMPIERNDTIFTYFSPQMLQGLVDPQYLIELRRRLHASADISMISLARLAAKAETNSAAGIDGLVDIGFLPKVFGQRGDGSGIITVGDRVVDTARGSRGTFLPIADVMIESVTQEEADWYISIAREYSDRFPQIDPIMIGVQREAIPDQSNRERLIVHAEIAPMVPEKYGKYAQQLGPPTKVAIQFAPDDIVAVQAHVASEKIGPPTHLFAGIKDSHPPQLDDFDGILGSYRSLKQLPGYLGAWPQPGTLDRLPLGLGRGTPVGPGMNRLIGGLYRYTDGGYSVLSFQPEILQASLPHINAIEVDDTAQVRFRIGNLAGSQLEGWVNEQLYQRAAESSRAGANFLSMLSRQLQIDPDDVPDAVYSVLGNHLVDPLGGRYEYSDRVGRWTSTAWGADDTPLQAPPNYVAPIMKWFRGAEGTLTQYSDRLVADAAIVIEHSQ